MHQEPPADPLATLISQATRGDPDALEELVRAIQDDVYLLAFRMLGLRAEAEDATQEVLVKIITNLATFRAESTFRTWVWRIATNHLLSIKRSRREEVASFETIERLIAKGEENAPLPAFDEAELAILAEEVKLSCTEAMVLSLERELRISWILDAVFDLSSEEAGVVLGLPPATHRKRLSRARERLGSWMKKKCGLADPENACRCRRQIPAAMAFGVVTRQALEYAGHPGREKRRLGLAEEATEIEAAAFALGGHPDYLAPPEILAQIRDLVRSGRYRLLQ